jgi:hypothetical protein
VKQLESKMIAFSFVAVMGIGLLGAAVGYQEYIYEFAGSTHDWGCHGVGNVSVNGTLVLSLNFTGNLSPSQYFTLEVDVVNFTEAMLAPYSKKFTLGVPGYIGDNGKLTSPLANQTLNRGETLSTGNASYNPTDKDNVFVLIAPATPGTYSVGAVAIAAINSTAKAKAGLFVMGFISIPGYEAPIMVAAIGVGILTIVTIAMKKKKTE